MDNTTNGAFVNLQHAAIGRPITRLGVSFFPVYLLDNGLPDIGTGPKSGWQVEELPRASVPTLVVKNPTARPVLIVEGEQFVGGDQNRTLNVSVLAPPAASLEIPVSCLEAGRWGRRRDFTAGSTFTHRRVRRAKNQAVAQQAATPRARRGDQGAVWNSIDAELAHLRVSAPTRSLAAADRIYEREPSRREAAEALGALGPLPRQCGVVVTHGPRLVATEIFGAPELLRPHWGALVRGYLLERPTDAGRPSASRVLRRLGRVSKFPCRETPGVGLGVEQHFVGSKAVGQALTLDGAVVHLSVLSGRAAAEPEGRGPLGSARSGNPRGAFRCRFPRRESQGRG